MTKQQNIDFLVKYWQSDFVENHALFLTTLQMLEQYEVLVTSEDNILDTDPGSPFLTDEELERFEKIKF